MHHRHFNYTDEDTKYAHDKAQEWIAFNYNSDLSGEIIIMSDREEMRVPGWMLLDFIGERVGSELISAIEDRTGREVLKLLGGY
jgi:hypothetical protein